MHSRWNEAEAQGYRKVREPLSLFPKSEGTDTNNLDFIVRRSPPEFAVNRNMMASS